MTRAAAAVCAALLFAAVARADLAAARAEPNLEKRAEKALDNAQHSLAAAQDAYIQKADLKQSEAALQELAESVQLAYESLMATGKNPSKKPKHFKRAEIKTRELMRRLDDFRAQMSALDRDAIEKTRDAVQKVHDDLLEGIMSGGKKK